MFDGYVILFLKTTDRFKYIKVNLIYFVSLVDAYNCDDFNLTKRHLLLHLRMANGNRFSKHIYPISFTIERYFGMCVSCSHVAERLVVSMVNSQINIYFM